MGDITLVNGFISQHIPAGRHPVLPINSNVCILERTIVERTKRIDIITFQCHQTWLGNQWRFVAGKDIYGRFSSTPCLITGGCTSLLIQRSFSEVGACWREGSWRESIKSSKIKKMKVNKSSPQLSWPNGGCDDSPLIFGSGQVVIQELSGQHKPGTSGFRVVPRKLRWTFFMASSRWVPTNHF